MAGAQKETVRGNGRAHAGGERWSAEAMQVVLHPFFQEEPEQRRQCQPVMMNVKQEPIEDEDTVEESDWETYPGSVEKRADHTFNLEDVEKAINKAMRKNNSQVVQVPVEEVSLLRSEVASLRQLVTKQGESLEFLMTLLAKEGGLLTGARNTAGDDKKAEVKEETGDCDEISLVSTSASTIVSTSSSVSSKSSPAWVMAQTPVYKTTPISKVSACSNDGDKGYFSDPRKPKKGDDDLDEYKKSLKRSSKDDSESVFTYKRFREDDEKGRKDKSRKQAPSPVRKRNHNYNYHNYYRPREFRNRFNGGRRRFYDNQRNFRRGGGGGPGFYNGRHGHGGNSTVRIDTQYNFYNRDGSNVISKGNRTSFDGFKEWEDIDCLKLKNEPNNNESDYDSEDEEVDLYACPNCPVKLKDRAAMDKHFKSHKSYVCPLCGDKCSLRSSLQVHLKRAHGLKGKDAECYLDL